MFVSRLITLLKKNEEKQLRWRHIHIPKTAGTALRENYTQGTEPGVGHAPAVDFKDKDIIKWAVVRDPYERAISICGHIFRALEDELSTETFQQWVVSGFAMTVRQGSVNKVMMGYVNDRHRFRITEPQVSWISPDTWLLDHARLKDHLLDFLPMIGLVYKPNKIVNAGTYKLLDPNRPYAKSHEYYEPVVVGTPEPILDLVEKRYLCDIELYRRLERSPNPVQMRDLPK
jgi:hypothetical protein